jgi:hypothetical protein
MVALLTRRAVVQAAVETTYNTPVAVTTADGILAADPMFAGDPTSLERNFARDTLSPQSHIVSRMLAKVTFQTELRGNGKEQSGLIADAPIITRLFRGCGYALTALATPSVFGVFDIDDQANRVAWVASAGTATNLDVIAYYLAVTTGGVSATAKITVTSDTAGEGTAAAVVTSGSPFTVGTKGLTLTPTFTGSLVVGQRWVVWLLPKGQKLTPISTNQESLTLVVHKDRLKHTVPGAFGTFTIDATSGDYAKVNWTFTGTYQAPVDAASPPSPVYERTLPSQVELARLRTDDFNAIVEKMTFDQANDIQIRPDVSSAEGYIGTRIVNRDPKGGINPEGDLVASYDFWGRLRNGNRVPFQMRVGTVLGNTVWMLAPSTQYTGMTYTDRQGIQAFDAGLDFSGYQGDDEVCFFFM